MLVHQRVFFNAVEHQYGGKELSPFQGENCEYLMTPCTAMAHKRLALISHLSKNGEILEENMGQNWDNSRINGGLNGNNSSC